MPPAVASNMAGTWAYDTMSRRIPYEIVRRIREDNIEVLRDNVCVSNSFNNLVEDICRGREGYLTDLDDGGDDCDQWSILLSTVPEEKRNWLDAPWLISEYYFYRRVVECFCYMKTSYDMFQHQKRAGLIDALPILREISDSLHQQLYVSDNKRNLLSIGIYTSLWGNKLDLSLWPNGGKESGRITTHHHFENMLSYILDDVSDALIDHLMKHTHESQVDIIVDNAGYELISDFILGLILLHVGAAQKVRFHTKGHPTFVSDATTKDCKETIEFLSDKCKDSSSLRWLSSRLNYCVDAGQFEFLDDNYWCQPIPMWDMPTSISKKLCASKVVVVKGDANYRRLLGDREWDFATPAADVLSYWAVPVCALRTFKSEIGCGIDKAKQLVAQNQDLCWKTSGKWGVVQFYQPVAETSP
jgi:uncharacterized protein with ATP-grasp and redox domains